MNTQTECNCCQPSACEVCSPQCSSSDHVRNRIERPLKCETDCGTKNCSIFDNHDAAPLPGYHCHLKPPKNENKNSLGSPIGLVNSNVNFKTDGKTGDIIQARYATYLKAFARLHLNDEKEWDSALLDDIMKEGLDLYTKSQSRQSAVETDTTDIYMSHEQDVLPEFQLSSFTFRIELMPKFQLLNVNSTEIGSTGDGFDLTLENILPALKNFLRQHKYGLLKVGTFYAMIWRSKQAYFLFDVCGRRLTDFRTDKEKGVVMLMCFKSLENIRHLINNLSGLQITEPLVIRELKLVKVVTPEGSIIQRDYGLRNHQYEIVNDDYAYLRSDLHLTLNKRDLLRNRSGLPVAVTAIVVSKIDHPATWDLKMVDKIICFGVNFWQMRCKPCESIETIDVSEFPTSFILGQFYINIDITDHFCQGTWHCVPAFKHSELSNALRKALNAKQHKLILQINYQMYAIWKKQEFIYLLDPYRHRIMGKRHESKIYEQMEKSATVRMFRAFEVFMNVLNQILLDSNRTSHFFLHCVKVKNIQTRYKEKQKPGQVRPVKEPQRDDSGEILSINEFVCFEEAEDLCKTTLGEISDYEDDDLKSDVVEIELRTSSSEEELLEEEEAGAGKVGEMEDIETSSSGEEGGGHKTTSRGNKTRGKGNAAKRKEAKKAGNNKNKEGKGANDNEKGGADSDTPKSVKGKQSNKSEQKIKSIIPKQNEETDDESDLRHKSGEHLKGKDGPKQRKDPETDKLTKDTSQAERIEMAITKNKKIKKKKELAENKSRAKDPSKGEHLSMDQTPNITEDTGPSPDKNISKDKPHSQDNGLSKDNDLNKTVAEQKDDISKGKLNEEINKSVVHSETKLDFGKGSAKDTTGEKEILKSFHKFDDEKTLIKNDKEEVKDVLKDKSVNRLKERNENLNAKSYKERDNENEECLRKSTDVCSSPNPNRYPGYSKYPADVTILGSESGRYASICKLFQAGFKVADRLLLMTAWGNFIIFRCMGQKDSLKTHYYLYDGCTCNFNRFRHFDLSVGTAGLICFEHLHNIIEYIRHLRLSRGNKKKQLSYSAGDICKEFCNESFILQV